MSEKGFAGGTIQIPTSVRWGGNGTRADQTGATTCKYIFQITDQNGDPILARQRVTLHLCTRASTPAGTDAGMGIIEPNATEIASSAAIAQANTVLIATTAVAAANDAVKVGSEDDTGNLHLAGVIGVCGIYQYPIPSLAGGGTPTMAVVVETDAEGKFTGQFVTGSAATLALVITLASGKEIFFSVVRAA